MQYDKYLKQISTMFHLDICTYICGHVCTSGMLYVTILMTGSGVLRMMHNVNMGTVHVQQ